MSLVAAASVWSLAAAPVSGASPLGARTVFTGGSIWGLSCEPGQCVAAGSGSISLHGPDHPQVWTLSHGLWSVVTHPGGTTPHQVLADVSCSVPDACVAVGSTQVGPASLGFAVGFAERLDGGAWQQTPLPANTPPLNSVSCVSSVWCMAVANTPDWSSGGIALEWNGTMWTQIQTAVVAPLSGLFGVSCLSPTSCVAVGSSHASPLAESWNGTAWTVTTPPAAPPTEGGFALSAVSCTSASFCLAVGLVAGCCGSVSGIEMSWDGSTWSRLSYFLGPLSGVSCTSSLTCLVVGSVSPSDGQNFQTYAIAARWNGTSLIGLRGTRAGRESSLDAVSCSIANWCAAVGSFTTPGGAIFPLVERWNGTTLNQMGVPL